MDSPLLNAPGAVPGVAPDAGVAAHYGNPNAEQRALAAGTGMTDRSHRGVVRITGPDRLSWLHSLTTQHLEHLEPGQPAEALILSPQGHSEPRLTLTAGGGAVWAHVEPGTAGALVAFLESMRFMLRVEPADVTAGYAVLTVTRALPADPLPGVVAALPGPVGTDLLVPRPQLQAAATQFADAGLTLAGMQAYEALRIATRRPRLGLATAHRPAPPGAGWADA